MEYNKRPRIIPCLLLQNGGLVKTTQFKNPRYLGDPRNVVKIFNDKEADELLLLDICATNEARGPNYELISEIASECFMPLGYGGGVTSVEQVQKLICTGLEKVVINTAAVKDSKLITESSEVIGSQSVVVSIDIRKRRFSKGYEVCSHSGKKRTGLDPLAFAKKMENAGAGELFINFIDRDGMMQGYDCSYVSEISNVVGIPVVVCGGAGGVTDLASAIEAGASAASAGSMFVFQGKLKAVLISFPSSQDLSLIK